MRPATEFPFKTAPDPKPEPDPSRYRLLSAADLAALPPLPELVKGVLPRSGIGALFGPSAAGKSFLVLDLLACIAAGRPWFGHEVKRAPVVYLGLEGAGGIPQRVRAYLARHDALAVHFVLGELDLRQPEDRAALVAAIKAAGLAGGVLCVDTLAASAPGLDENSSVDMSEYISTLKGLQSDLGGLVLAVHHSGKDATRGLRGHSSLLAALDAVVEVTRTDERREWRIAKSKDGADSEAQPFRLEVVELGDSITSCVVVPEEQPADTVRRAALPAGGNQRVIYDALAELLKTARHFGEGGSPPTRPCIQLEDAIAKTRDRLTCESDRKTERTRQAFTGLIARAVIRHRDGWVYLA